jgi:WD40 repeat protein
MLQKLSRVIVAGVCGGLFGVILFTNHSPRVHAEPVEGQPTPVDGKPGVDRYGDPLPKGAVARLGTTRFRQARHVAFSPDGKTIAICGFKTISIWDVKTGKELRRFEAEKRTWGLAFSPDGRKLAMSRLDWTSIDIFDLTGGKEERRLQTEISARDFDTHSLAFSRDGKNLHFCDKKNCYVWDVESGRVVSTLQHRSDEDVFTYALGLSADGSRLAVIQGGMQIKGLRTRVWDTATGNQLHTFEPGHDLYRCLIFTPDATRLVLGCSNGTVEFRVWPLERP